MPIDSGMAFVVVLHLSPEHESHLDSVLQIVTEIPVTQVNETVTVTPNHIYVIPPSKHLVMVDGEIRRVEPDKIPGRRVPIDLFFRTLAEAYGKNAISIILSGTGTDGTLGLKRIKEEGGICIVQDPAEAEYDGMPRSAINTGLVDLILPIAEMPQRLLNIKRGAEKLKLPAVEDDKLPPDLDAETLGEILTLVRVRTGHDFSSYKQPTMLRRIARRLHVHGLENLQDYLEVLREQPEEAKALLGDLLISVTNFFRDKEAFAALENVVIPRLFAGKTADDYVRVWCVACATGEEAYSVAILLAEFASKIADPPKIQVFASDINEKAIAIARECRYDETISIDVSPERLRRFFTKEVNYYRVKKEIRDLMLFTPHNILRDVPFSRQDLITCRNLLIYLNRETQEKVLETFHFALQQDGYLFLSLSETAESVPALFTIVDKEQRIYKARSGIKSHRLPALPLEDRWQIKLPKVSHAKREESFSVPELYHKLVDRVSPPNILINENYDILHISEKATRFLQVISGEPTRNLGKLAHSSLGPDLLAALFAAKQDKVIVESGRIRMNFDGVKHFVTITVYPIDAPEAARGFFLVVFAASKDEDAFTEVGQPILDASAIDARDTVNRHLEEDLQNTKERLRLTIESSESSAEELKASNEELQAINEELRSTTEELQTSKEEMQSVNEELKTVNHELKDKIDEVTRSSSDLQNLIASTDIGTIFLDRALQIKLYTPPTHKLFNIIASDIGRPLEHITHKLDYKNLLEEANAVLETLQAIEREVRGEDGKWYLTRFAPYRTMDDRIDGVVMTFVDITKRKNAEDELLKATRQIAHQARVFETTLSSITDFAYSFDREGRFTFANKPMLDLWGLKLVDVIGKNFFDLDYPKALAEKLQQQIQQVFQTKRKVRDETSFTSPRGVSGYYEHIFSPVFADDGTVELVVGSTRDVTERRQMEETLKDNDRRKDEFLATLAHELRNPLAPIRSGLEIIQRNDYDRLAIGQVVNIVERQTDQIVRLVDDLLDISRISQGTIKLKKAKVELKTAIELALDTSREVIESSGHRFTISLPKEPIYIDGDLTRLAQIFLNLLNNAAKYSPPESEIWLTVKPEPDDVVISVRDEGIGIPGEMLAKVFEMFIRIQKPSEQARGGLGIGLSVVKKLVELHGGTVTAFSAGEGKGSEFIVRLPLWRKAAAIAESSKRLSEKEITQNAILKTSGKADNEAANGKQILVVDDNADAMKMIEVLLSLEGHKVRTALDGETAIEIAKEFQPDVCLCDIGLPVMDGYEVARQLRKIIPQALLISLSGWGREKDREHSREAGFDYHLVKPVQVEDVLTLLQQNPADKDNNKKKTLTPKNQ
jgi:two-component system CheB/CheR fusion protein